MKNFVKEGDVINYTNGTGTDIASGDVVVIGTMVGVAVTNILKTETGCVQVEGVFKLDKTTSLVITQGDEVFWNTSTKKVTKTVTDKPLGNANTSEISAATTVEVRLKESAATPVAAVVAALGATTNLTAIGASFADEAAARTAVNTLATEVEARLDAAEAKVDALLASLKAAGLMATS